MSQYFWFCHHLSGRQHHDSQIMGRVHHASFRQSIILFCVRHRSQLCLLLKNRNAKIKILLQFIYSIYNILLIYSICNISFVIYHIYSMLQMFWNVQNFSNICFLKLRSLYLAIIKVCIRNMPKYWGKQIFSHRSFPKVGENQKAEKKNCETHYGGEEYLPLATFCYILL